MRFRKDDDFYMEATVYYCAHYWTVRGYYTPEDGWTDYDILLAVGGDEVDLMECLSEKAIEDILSISIDQIKSPDA